MPVGRHSHRAGGQLTRSTLHRSPGLGLQALGGGTMQYLRIDGSTALEDRESAIQKFNAKDSEAFIFLLSIRWVCFHVAQKAATCWEAAVLATACQGLGGLHLPAVNLVHMRWFSPAFCTLASSAPAWLGCSASPHPHLASSAPRSAAGRGLNLQSSDTVVIYDPDPNPKNEEQAIARWVAGGVAGLTAGVLHLYPTLTKLAHLIATHCVPPHSLLLFQLAPHRPDQGGAGHPLGVGGR